MYLIEDMEVMRRERWREDARGWRVARPAPIRQLAFGDAEFPAHLREIPAPPDRLWVRGRLVAEDALAIAIVGSRRATPYGLEVAERLAGDLAARGVTIVSGLARGIDSAAHRGALEAGGRTIAVLGCGVDVVYPPENRRLAARHRRARGAPLAVRARRPRAGASFSGAEPGHRRAGAGRGRGGGGGAERHPDHRRPCR